MVTDIKALKLMNECNHVQYVALQMKITMYTIPDSSATLITHWYLSSRWGRDVSSISRSAQLHFSFPCWDPGGPVTSTSRRSPGGWGRGRGRSMRGRGVASWGVPGRGSTLPGWGSRGRGSWGTTTSTVWIDNENINVPCITFKIPKCFRYVQDTQPSNTGLRN